MREFEYDLFFEEKAYLIQKKFSKKIEGIGEKVREKNLTRKYPTKMLLPERIVARINI